jgi:WD40 repeat protein/serine/threonine protein kinase
MIGCPSAQQLEQLLTDLLREPAKGEVEAHLESCAACQNLLERLADDTALDGAPGSACDRTGEPTGADLSFLDGLKQASPWTQMGNKNDNAQPAETSGQSPGRFPNVQGYEVLRELGHGGMGVVYQARQVGLSRLVALKMLLAEAQTSTAALARFRTEAEAVARLQHPNIVQIYEVGERDGRPYLALEYVEGGSLARKVAGTPLSGRQGAELVETLARAMQVAHQHHIVHRDLKPANILLSTQPKVLSTELGMAAPSSALSTQHSAPITLVPKITDFGLAKLLDGAVGQTQSGGVLGTPPYMAPEQAAGKGQDIGPHTDVYALGAILYECLTGRAPFQADTPLETLQQVVGEEPMPPSRLRPKLPRDLETICLKCLQKEPARRYASAIALADDLHRFLNGEPIRARPVGRTEKFWRWCRRNPTLAGAFAAASLFLVLGTTVSTLLAFQAHREATRAKARSYASEMKLANLDWDAGRTSMVQQRLREQTSEPGEADLRGFEWYYLNRLCQLELHAFRAGTNTVTIRKIAYSADGKHLAAAYDDGAVKLWDVITDQEIMKIKVHTGPINVVAFSPDGKRLITAAGNRPYPRSRLLAAARPRSGVEGETVKVWDAVTGQAILAYPRHKDAVFAVAWSPDGTRVASGGRDGIVKVWDPTTGAELHSLHGHTAEILGLAFSLDGKQLASASADDSVKLWDPATGQPAHTLEGHTDWVYGVAFSPDSRLLATGAADDTVRLWNTATGRELKSLKGHIGRIYSVAFRPDGRQLASGSYDGTVRLWDPTTGGEVTVLRQHTHVVFDVAYSLDGRRLVSASEDGIVRIWDASIWRKTLTFRGHADRLMGVAFSPDGRRVASASQDGTVKVWDAATSRGILTLTGHREQVYGVAFDPSGRWIASGSKDGTVRVWDAGTGDSLFTLPGHTDWVMGVAFSPVGSTLASIGEDGTLRIWDAATGQESAALPTHPDKSWNAPCNPAFSPDGRRVACPGADHTITVWDIASGQNVLTCRGHTSQVIAVAFSPDGKQLASTCGGDHIAKLWDAATGQEIRPLQTYTGTLLCLTFSPDGRRLVCAGCDPTLRMWDTATGQEILTLQGHSGRVHAVAFSPDGRRLASASADGTAMVWDTTELTPQARIVHEAQGLVEWLFAKPLSPDEVTAAVRRDPSITEAVRQEAFAWVEPFWDRQVHAEAARVVAPLFANGRLRSEVRAAVSADLRLNPAVRHEALTIAETFPENAAALNQSSWAVVRNSGASASSYQHALRQAEAACKLEPNHNSHLSTRGVACYRVGRYQEALEALLLSNQVNKSSDASDLAFLTMAHHQLGQQDHAVATLSRLREAMRQPGWAKNAEAQGFLREAEELLKTDPADGKRP